MSVTQGFKNGTWGSASVTTLLPAPSPSEVLTQRSLVVDEGPGTGGSFVFNGADARVELDKCKANFIANDNCHSFAWCSDGCWMKNKVITANDRGRPLDNRTCYTYYEVPC
jgi:NADH:ubiquinone oxidoreductase subunit F (NADH-binding)